MEVTEGADKQMAPVISVAAIAHQTKPRSTGSGAIEQSTNKRGLESYDDVICACARMAWEVEQYILEIEIGILDTRRA